MPLAHADAPVSEQWNGRPVMRNLTQSWMIGDTLRDILAGQNAGCRGCILVRTGQSFDESEWHRALPFVVADDLLAAALHIIHEPRT